MLSFMRSDDTIVVKQTAAFLYAFFTEQCWDQQHKKRGWEKKKKASLICNSLWFLFLLPRPGEPLMQGAANAGDWVTQPGAHWMDLFSGSKLGDRLPNGRQFEYRCIRVPFEILYFISIFRQILINTVDSVGGFIHLVPHTTVKCFNFDQNAVDGCNK